jgi:uncharacterized protein (TIGR00645 family)
LAITVRDSQGLAKHSFSREAHVRPRLEIVLEWIIFASRWILAPLYISMISALGAIVVVFFRELAKELAHVLTMDGEGVILLSLSLVDLSLTANLLLIVIFAGYENFVSKIHVGASDDRPNWMGTVDFSGLKLKLIASIVAISAIALLRSFLPLGDVGAVVETGRLRWMIAIHLTFVVSGVFLALMDLITSRTQGHGRDPEGSAVPRRMDRRPA